VTGLDPSSAQQNGATRPDFSPRQQQILESLAGELETSPGSRITTARLAEVVGVSEAALYRHFSGKAAMFEALIEFAEQSVVAMFSELRARAQGGELPLAEANRIALHGLLSFAERNPGISRVLLGDALVGEASAIQERAARFFDRVDTELRQLWRLVSQTSPDGLGATAYAAPGYEGMYPRAGAALDVRVRILSAYIEGRMHRYVSSGFRQRPTDDWEAQWSALARVCLSDPD
jgi:TetR/AcrR family transcriptional regulator